MSPLSDRVVITLLIATVALVFALVFWTVRLAPSAEPRLQWRQGAPEAQLQPRPTAAPALTA